MTLTANTPPETKPAGTTQPAAETKSIDRLLPNSPASVCPTLVKILSWKRPHGTDGEKNFCEWLRRTISEMGNTVKVCEFGNTIVEIRPDKGEDSTVLFSCHVDTVHSKDGAPQSVSYDPVFGHIFLDTDDPEAGSCLGADDGAGIWLMLQMIKAKKPGTYVFHRGEERGGLGAKAMLDKQKEWLGKFECAVAFDRPGDYEVITHQGGVECASQKFGQALANALSSTGVLKYQISNRGLFTDTKIYRGVIAECVNIGVGYMYQHGRDETLDYAHLTNLLEAVLATNFDALPIDRDPTKADTYSYGGYQGRGVSPFPQQQPTRKSEWGAKGNAYGFHGDDGLDEEPDGRPAPPAATHTPLPSANMTLLEELQTMRYDDILSFVETDPTVATEALVELLADLAGEKARNKTLRFLLGLDT